MKAVLPLAERMLSQYGEFYPYGAYLKRDGTIVEVGAEEPDTDRPKSKDLIYVLRSSFREMASTNQCTAVAIVFDVAVILPKSDRKSDAIQVCLDHANGYSGGWPTRKRFRRVAQVFALEFSGAPSVAPATGGTYSDLRACPFVQSYNLSFFLGVNS